MAERRGSFTSKGQLNSSLQSRQVGIDKSYGWDDADAHRAEQIGLNDDGTWNTWGQVQNQILGWVFGAPDISRAVNAAERDRLMSKRTDDFGRAWRSEQGQAQMEAEHVSSYGQTIEGGKVAASVVTMGKSYGAGQSGGGGEKTDAELDAEFEARVDKDIAAGEFGTPDPAYVVDPNKAGVQAGGADTQYSYLTDKEKKGPDGGQIVGDVLQGGGVPQSQTGFQPDQSKLVDVSWANSVPIVGDFIGHTANYANQNEIMGQTINDYLGNLDRSLSLYEYEFAG